MPKPGDPRVFFAAERTLLAWTRTSVTLMAFGFVIERFGLFMQFFRPDAVAEMQRGVSYWVGIAFIALGAFASAVTAVQFRRMLKDFRPEEIPERHAIHMGVLTSLIVALLGVGLIVYLFRGPPL